jgi:hypothetical protein
MKKFKVLLVALVLLFASTTIFAQEGIASGFLKPVTKESLVADNGDKELISATWKLRLDASIVGLASYISDFGNPKPFAKMGIGPVFTRFDTDASRTWAVGAMLTIPTAELAHYGVAAVGSYSIFKLGLNYDFGVPFKDGFCILTGLSIDLFNVVQ